MDPVFLKPPEGWSLQGQGLSYYVWSPAVPAATNAIVQNSLEKLNTNAFFGYTSLLLLTHSRKLILASDPGV